MKRIISVQKFFEVEDDISESKLKRIISKLEKEDPCIVSIVRCK